MTAQYTLGMMYNNGNGVPKDYVLSHMWLSLAAAGGSKPAIEFRDKVISVLTPEQIAESNRLTHEWQATH